MPNVRCMRAAQLQARGLAVDTPAPSRPAASGAVEETVDTLVAAGEQVGMLRIRLFQPFPADQILAALDALIRHDAERALQVIQDDRVINEAQFQLSSQIATLIATQQPVARDLRFLPSLDHVSYELERMGDHAASVAKQARKLAPYPPLGAYAELPEMARLTASLVRGILGALVDIDESAARTVAARDDEVDELYHRIFE